MDTSSTRDELDRDVRPQDREGRRGATYGIPRPGRCAIAVAPTWSLRAPDGLRSRDLRLDRAVRTARLLYGRKVFGCRWCRAPNGIRTRASALKGRRPRPLDDGGVTPERTGPRGQPKEYSQAPCLLASGRWFERVAVAEVGAERALEDVPRAWAREEQPPGSHRMDTEHPKVAIEPHDRDRERHPEGVHRPATAEEHRVSGRE